MLPRRTALKEKTTFFHIAYDLGLALAAVIIILALIHHAATTYSPVDQILSPTEFAVTFESPPALTSGDGVSVYRFSSDWTNALGQATVERVAGKRAVFRYDPSTFHYNLGRQGRVVESSAEHLVVNVGSNLGFVPGNRLIVFRGFDPVGRIRLLDVSPDSSTAIQETGQNSIAPGSVVSEFTVPTQVVVCDGRALTAIDVAVLLGVLLAAAFFRFRYGRSPFGWIGGGLHRLIALLDRPAPLLAWNAITGLLFSWVGVRFLTTLIDVLAMFADALAYRLSPTFGAAFRAEIPAIAAFLDGSFPYLFVAAALGYGYCLFRFKKSPALLLWQKIGFNGGPLKAMPRGSARDAAIWILHLVIAYAFAYSLFAFIRGNIHDALQTAWPNSGIQANGDFDLRNPIGTVHYFQSTFAMAIYMLSHAPHFQNVDGAFVVVRDAVFNFTIAGCLIGYGHSVLGFLWGKRIYNLDFTVPGWITNAWCYGPLLGIITALLAQQLQQDVVTGGLGGVLGSPGPISYVGTEPVFTSGVMPVLVLSVELTLNFLYMLTIFNLGTKFGVMTDKGVCKSGFYSVVRHPSYTLEALMFIALYLKGLTSGTQWLAVGVIFVMTYWLRSEREDQFMTASNPEFAAYRDRTPYKFIPGIY